MTDTTQTDAWRSWSCEHNRHRACGYRWYHARGVVDLCACPCHQQQRRPGLRSRTLQTLGAVAFLAALALVALVLVLALLTSPTGGGNPEEPAGPCNAVVCD